MTSPEKEEGTLVKGYSEATTSESTLLLDIALRDGICVDEVLLLLRRWVSPLIWEFPRVLQLAADNDPAWQAWRVHHNELMAYQYYAQPRW